VARVGHRAGDQVRSDADAGLAGVGLRAAVPSVPASWQVSLGTQLAAALIANN
jgi:hypothetical protein